MPADRAGSAGNPPAPAWPPAIVPSAPSSAESRSTLPPPPAPSEAYPGTGYAPSTPSQPYPDVHSGARRTSASSAAAYSHDLPHPHLASHAMSHPASSWSDQHSALPHPAAMQHGAAHSHYPATHGLQIDTGRPLWQDEGRRKSLKLSNGDDSTLPLAHWQWPGAPEARRASGDQGHYAQQQPQHHPHQQQQHGADSGSSSMLPSPAVPNGAMSQSSWAHAGAHFPAAPHYFPSLPNPYGGQQSAQGPPGSSDGRPGSSAAAYSTPYGNYASLPGSSGGVPSSYVSSYGAPGAPAYLPYTPTSSAFSPSAYTRMFSYTSPASAAAAFASSSSHQQPLAPPTSAYSQQAYASYLPTPRTHLPPTPTIPPQAMGGAVGPASTTESPTSPSFPVDAANPYIPRDPSAPPAQCVLVAAVNRDKLGTIDLTGHTRSNDVAARRSSTAQSTRRAVDLEYDCQNCRRKIGRLTLRGGAVEKAVGDNPTKYRGVFYCTSCVAPPPGSATGTRTDNLAGGVTAYATEATYHDTMSAAVDRYQGIDPKEADTRPPPAAPGKIRSGFTAHSALGTAGPSKKRRASVADESEGVLACDVCRRDLATGTLQLAATGEAVGATVEVLCAHCESRYTRCSDCGGGGGSKGVGRWRCTQLFPPGRRTCMLLHTRVGTVSEMDYDVWPISSIGSEQMPELLELCKDLYYTNILGTLGVPDMLESVSPIARSYAEVEKLCVDSWTTYEPLVTDDIEATTETRRYIALRWVRPSSRKKRSRKSASANSAENGSNSPEEGKAQVPGSPLVDSPKSGIPLVREGKVLTGFIIAELDLKWGSLHVALTLPTGAGESYDASTRLMQTLVARVHEEVTATNAQRAALQLPQYPQVATAWTMHMTKRDSRIMSRLETRRGFIPLDDFLVKHPETDPKHFAPYRPTYLPPEYLRGWHVYAKRLTQDDIPPTNASSLSSNGAASYE